MGEHIKDLLADFLETAKNKQKEKEKVWENVKKILGEETTKYLQIEEITGEKIIFSSIASGAKYNLELQKKEVVEEIKKDFPQINKIIIKAGKNET